MALIKAGNGSSLSGLVGAVVIVQTKWGSYMRSAPHYSDSSWTKNQGAHRERFKKVSTFARQFKETVIAQVWNDPGQRVSGHGRFLKANMQAFSAQGELIDPALIQLSTGELELPRGLQLIRPEMQGTPIEVNWPDSGSGIRSRDELMVVSAGEGIYSEILNTGILRAQKGGSFMLPELKAAATHVYLFFGSRDRRSYSGSECFEVSVN